MKSYRPPTNAFQNRADAAIAHGALTNSKRPECFVKGVYPAHMAKGKGCYLWDHDNKRYIDFVCGLGSNLLGYAHEEITQAIVRQAQLGTTLSLGTDMEVETAEKVKELFPFIEKVRFLKTGSEACSAAIRIARAYTGKKYIYSNGYHGWHDDFVSLTPPAYGVPERNWMHSRYDNYHELAACITEPVQTKVDCSIAGGLAYLKLLMSEKRALTIFDEVITGFRYPQFSVATETGVTPDLICLGKAMGGGLPIAVVGGKSEIMDSDYFVSSTFAGETLSLAASLKLMQLLQTKYDVGYLWEKGNQFLEKFNNIWPEGVTLEGYATRSVLKGSDLNKALFMQECCKAGILIGPSFFFIFPHIELMEQVISTFSDILKRIRAGEVKLEGEMPKQAFAQKVRNQ